MAPANFPREPFGTIPREIREKFGGPSRGKKHPVSSRGVRAAAAARRVNNGGETEIRT